MTNAIDDLAELAEIVRPQIFVVGRDFHELCSEIEAQLSYAERGHPRRARKSDVGGRQRRLQVDY